MNSIAEKLLAKFDESAQNWGWGIGPGVEAACVAYELSRAALVEYIEELQRYKTAVTGLQEQLAYRDQGPKPKAVIISGTLVDSHHRERAYRYLFVTPVGTEEAISTIQTRHMPGSKVLTLERDDAPEFNYLFTPPEKEFHYLFTSPEKA